MACLIGDVAECSVKSQGERGSVILDRSSYLWANVIQLNKFDESIIFSLHSSMQTNSVKRETRSACR